MAFKTIQRVFVPNLKLSGPRRTELLAKEVEEFLLCYIGKWAGEHGCRNINVWRFSELWTPIVNSCIIIGISTRNLQRYFKLGLFTLCKNFVE